LTARVGEIASPSPRRSPAGPTAATEEAARPGAAARERIRARYDWEKVADAHDSFFRAVAARHGIAVSQRPSPSELGA
jgi:hypothetical protein